MAAHAAKKADPYAAWREPQFRAFWAYRLFVALAIQMQSVAVGWQIYDLTHSALALGFIGLAEAVPALGVALPAGHFADVMNRRTVLVSATAWLLISFVGLAVISLPQCAELLHGYALPIYGIIFLTGVSRGFQSPAQFGILGQIVPGNAYGNASAWVSTMWQSACIGGPAAGGLLYAFGGAALAYGVAAALTLAGLLLLFQIHAGKASARSGGQSVIASIREGLHFVWRNQVVLGAMSLDLFAVLFGGAVALLPIYADTIFKSGPVGLGLLRAAPAVGAVVIGVGLAHWPIARRAGKALFWNVAAFGIVTILFAVSTDFYWAFLWLALSGGFDAVSVFVRQTTFQIVTPDHMKGRVAAVSSIFIGSSNEIGEFESGVTARMIGTVHAVVFGGCMTLVVVALTAILTPKLRRLDLGTVRAD